VISYATRADMLVHSTGTYFARRVHRLALSMTAGETARDTSGHAGETKSAGRRQDTPERRLAELDRIKGLGIVATESLNGRVQSKRGGWRRRKRVRWRGYRFGSRVMSLSKGGWR
jgi:hypothetical protein